MKQLIILLFILINLRISYSQEYVEIDGALVIRNSSQEVLLEGMIRFNPISKDFEGFNGFYWVSLTGNITFETDSLIDDEGNSYKSVKIGSQWWMAENLNVGTRIEGITTQSNNAQIEKFCYNDEEANCNIYGGLYQWSEMMQYTVIEKSQGICPIGWHIPSDAEWTELALFLDPSTNIDIILIGEQSTIAGGKMKELGIIHWAEPNVGATNHGTFTSLPAGFHNDDGTYDNIKNVAYYWSSSLNVSSAWMRYLVSNSESLYRNNDPNPGVGYSVRCVKD